MPATVQLARQKLDLKGLVWTLVRTDFKVRYHGTALGFVWALLKPVVMVLVLTGVFSFVFSAQPRYRLRLLVGLFLWEFFAEGTRVGLESLRVKGHLISKTVMPRWLMPVASLSNPLVTLAVVLTAMLGVLHLSGISLHLTSLLAFAGYVLCLLMFVVGICLSTSVIYLRYRDLNQVWDLVLQAGFFLAPIVYPLSALPERLHFILYLWPPTPIIEFSRAVLIDGVTPSLRAHCFLAFEAFVLLGTGVLLFRRMQPRLAEHL